MSIFAYLRAETSASLSPRGRPASPKEIARPLILSLREASPTMTFRVRWVAQGALIVCPNSLSRRYLCTRSPDFVLVFLQYKVLGQHR